MQRLEIVLEGQLTWQKCPVALCFAGLYLLGLLQFTTLPHNLLGRLAPGTAKLYRDLLPATPEELPYGEARGEVFPPPGTTISLCPGATRREVLKVLAVFLLFAAVRNLPAATASMRRLSVTVVVNGTLLPLFGLIQFFVQCIYKTKKKFDINF